MSRLQIRNNEVALTESIGANILLEGVYEGNTHKLQNLYNVLNKFKLNVSDYMPKPRAEKDRVRLIYQRQIQ